MSAPLAIPSSLRIGRRIWPWLAAAGSGGLLTLCFPPFNVGWLCWIALTPLICAVWFQTSARSLFLGYVAGLVFFTITFSWLSALGALFENVWLYGLPPLLSLYLAFYFAFWAWFIGRLLPPPAPAGNAISSSPLDIKGPLENASAVRGAAFLNSRRNLITATLGASAWVTHEWIRGWLFSGFGWNDLGVALHRDLAMMQIVDITGVPGLSFLVAFCNLMIVILTRRIAAEFGPVFLKRVRWEFSVTVALVAGVFAYGVRTLMQRPAQTTVDLRVAAVQPNIPQLEKFAPEAEDKIFEQLGQLTTLAAATQPQLLIWPEAATPRGIFADEANYRFVIDHAAQGDFGLLIGTLDSDLQLQEHYNVATLLTERGTEFQTYRKMHLVPFGEYIPLRNSFPLFALIAGELVPGDFARGQDFTVLQLPSPPLQLAALICFEDTLGDLTRRFVQNGADLLVNLTNDGWFLQTPAAEQHLANAVFRAVENRRPLIRCANTGVTCSIDAHGRIDRWLKPFERGFAARRIRVPIEQRLTFYTRRGPVFVYGAILITGLTIGSFVMTRRQR